MNFVFLFFANSIQATNQANISCGPLVLKRDLKDEFRPDGNYAVLYQFSCGISKMVDPKKQDFCNVVTRFRKQIIFFCKNLSDFVP